MRKPIHVMIVEDERIVALHLRQQLARLGYDRTSVHSAGINALKAIETDAPDIILMDIRIDGDLDGIETAAGIPEHLMIPIIYLSAYSEDTTLERARKTRPYGFLLKPFSERELHATIQMALERREVELALRESQERLSLAMHAAQMSCWEVDVSTRKMHSTGLGKFIPGETHDAETITESWDGFLERVSSEDRDMVRKAFEYAVLNGEFYDIVFRGQSHDNSHQCWFRARGKSYINDRKGTQRIIGVMQDITDQRITNDKLRQAMTVFETTQDGILILDPDLNITSANRAYCQITGADPLTVTGTPPYMIVPEQFPPAFYQELFHTLRTRRHWHREIDTRDMSGNPISIVMQIIAVEDDDGVLTHFVAMISDRTAIRQAEQELHYLAQYDGLTGLPNRLLATDRLNRAIERCERTGAVVACLFLDLDDFKNINDTLGHAAGDQVLLIVSTRIKALTDRTDTIARLGGDEFLIVRENMHSHAAAGNLASQIIHELQKPFYIVGHELTLSASIGIALYPENAHSPQDLIRLADTAMYAAKDQGRRTYAFYKSEMTESATHYMTRSLELRRGLEKGELSLYYQPQVDAHTGEMTGAEALIRWNHPENGLLGPAEIIPVAEQSGLIVEIGQWVVEEACAQASRWQNEGQNPIRIAINVSVRQMRSPGFAKAVQSVLTDTGLDPKWLEIEVTESMIQDEDIMIDTLHELRAVGVSVAIDDFGTGYSCLRSIKSLPIERIKIDRAFINGIPQNTDDAALAEAMIAMARTLGLKVTAEGVETAAQRDFLRAQGCSELQGFLFSKPVPAEQLFAATHHNAKIS
ncbi:EAL domain-containing protein [Thalassospira xiamenensis]|jgi:diguanylate cyclase (GGDEF)-like protein/PAS domain S-box-containing protein|uniref:Diguanylate cyclase n=1 Tax=Thalassospira xiamenensis TaxID=220697 RepID=A0A367X356_9PROT|nr:EAL domain-containing protein [Thalassospira xiamenensis]KZB51447.1 diguanylate cyclase [Thalassospira xiamenensis]MCK2166445.1 EAL domain-containing protein [Thalassospira xiamenensis]RCK48103.1 diguanylate cyclase [Thalassospira xiamenensis]UKV15587.1 EAL domain-containing protein [Thalassospiraceae bacterium SW-3-3]